tara:strand:+ start:2808 stop:3014 length:207 start_codon:yes stop_codon:yes gene_type:complete
MYEVKTEECCHSTKSRKTYNVNLISWDRRGSGVSFGKAFNVGKRAAKKEALYIAELYNAEIVDNAGIM